MTSPVVTVAGCSTLFYCCPESSISQKLLSHPLLWYFFLMLREQHQKRSSKDERWKVGQQTESIYVYFHREYGKEIWYVFPHIRNNNYFWNMAEQFMISVWCDHLLWTCLSTNTSAVMTICQRLERFGRNSFIAAHLEWLGVQWSVPITTVTPDR